VAAADRGQRIVSGLGHLLGVAEEDPAGAGQRQAAARPREQRDSQLALQAPDLIGDRRLGAMQGARGGIERAQLGGGAEVEELLEGQGRALTS
jgi:hypothetical protein